MRTIDDGRYGLALAAACLALMASPALAQSDASGPIATAPATPLPSSDAPPAPLRTESAVDEDQAQPPVRDGKVHGVVEAGVGTNGYRHGAVAADAPLPNGGDVAIAVESDQIQGRGRRLAN